MALALEFSVQWETQKLKKKHRVVWALRDAHTELREKQGGPPPTPGCVWGSFAKQGTGAWGRRYVERGAGRRVGSMYEGKKCGIWGKTFIHWFLNYLSSSKCWACVERWGPHQAAKSFPSSSLILKAEVTIKMHIKWQKDCRVLSTMKEMTLGREQEKLGEVGCGDGSRGGFGESTYHRCENRTPGKQRGPWPAQAKAGSTQETKEAREAGAQGRTVMEWVMEVGTEYCGSYGRRQATHI